MTNEPINNPAISPSKAPSSIGNEGAESNLDLSQQGAPSFNLNSSKGGAAGLEEAPTPMEVAQSATTTQAGVGVPTVGSLQNQAENINKSLQPLSSNLNQFHQQYPQATFKEQWASRINSHIDTSLNAQNYLANQLQTEPLQIPKASSDIVHFLNYISGSQEQIQSIQSSLAAAPPDSLTPGKLLAIQAKMNTIQLQVNFFTTVIGQGGEDLKTIMNIQS